MRMPPVESTSRTLRTAPRLWRKSRLKGHGVVQAAMTTACRPLRRGCGIPQPRLKGRQAVVIAACTTPWPFNLLFRQSRGAVRSVREVLSTGGMRIRSVEIAGTKALDGHLPEAARRKIERLVERVLKTK